MSTPYNETSTFSAEVESRADNILKAEEDLNLVKAQCAALPKKKRKDPPNPEAEALRKKRDRLKARVKSCQSRLLALYDLNKLPLWYKVQLLSAAEDELWTLEQAATWSKELAAHEGRGEKALRLRYGVTAGTTTEDCDIIWNGLRLEVKNLEGRSVVKGKNRWVIQEIQTGHNGRKTYTRWMGLAAEALRFKGLGEEFRDAIFCGEVTGGMLFNTLPEELRKEMWELLRPSNVLKHYDAVIGTTRFGSITVPKADFDKAWSLKNVTKSGPKYKLKEKYVDERLAKTLASGQLGGLEDVPVANPIDAAGQVLEERILVASVEPSAHLGA